MKKQLKMKKQLNLNDICSKTEKVEDCTKLDIKTKTALVCFVLFLIFRHCSFDETVLKNVDMKPFSEPIQEKIENGKSFKEKTLVGDVYITPIANYKIYGRVYDRHCRPARLYWASVYPYDVSIGFGDFRHKEVYKAVKVKMAATVSYLSWSGSAWHNHLSKYFKEQSMEHCFTNNHIRPANGNVKRGIKKLRKKDVVYMEGYLIKFEHKLDNGKSEKGISSTSRDDEFRGDNGYGNCEQFYVTRVVSRYGDFR